MATNLDNNVACTLVVQSSDYVRLSFYPLDIKAHFQKAAGYEGSAMAICNVLKQVLLPCSALSSTLSVIAYVLADDLCYCAMLECDGQRKSNMHNMQGEEANRMRKGVQGKGQEARQGTDRL